MCRGRWYCEPQDSLAPVTKAGLRWDSSKGGSASAGLLGSFQFLSLQSQLSVPKSKINQAPSGITAEKAQPTSPDLSMSMAV